jgi:hypothetical protein
MYVLMYRNLRGVISMKETEGISVVNSYRAKWLPVEVRVEVDLLEVEGRNMRALSDELDEAEMSALGGEAFVSELKLHETTLPLHHEFTGTREYDDLGWGARHKLPAPQYGQH